MVRQQTTAGSGGVYYLAHHRRCGCATNATPASCCLGPVDEKPQPRPRNRKERRRAWAKRGQ